MHALPRGTFSERVLIFILCYHLSRYLGPKSNLHTKCIALHGLLIIEKARVLVYTSSQRSFHHGCIFRVDAISTGLRDTLLRRKRDVLLNRVSRQAFPEETPLCPAGNYALLLKVWPKQYH